MLPLGAAFITAPARADDASAQLTYSAPDVCLSQQLLQRAVEARLQRPVFVAAADADLLVELTVRLDPALSSWKAALTLRSRAGNWLGSRELQSESSACAGLSEPLALVLALIIDVDRAEIPAPPPELPGSASAPSRAPPRTLRVPDLREHVPAAVAPAIEPPRRTRVARGSTGRVGIQGFLALGLLPEAALGVRASAALSPPAFWTIEIGAAAWMAERARRGTAGSEFTARTLDVLVCPLEHTGAALGTRVQLAMCAAQTLLWLRAEGFGLDRNRAHSRFYTLFGGRLRAALALTGPLSLRAGAGAEAPATRDEYFYLEADGQPRTLHRIAPVVGFGELGLELTF
jgi:hypothetical protein